VQDKRQFLHKIHEQVGEKFVVSVTEENKTGRYRKTLLSYAIGNVLEVGIGTGTNLQFYDSAVVK
jgi:uncharacterized protein YlxP (DUF503 family)